MQKYSKLGSFAKVRKKAETGNLSFKIKFVL